MTKTDILNALRRPSVVIPSVAVASAVLGGGVTYLVMKDRLRLHYEEISKKEIAEARSFFARIDKTGEFADPTAMAQAKGISVTVEEKEEYADEVKRTNYGAAFNGETPKSQEDLPSEATVTYEHSEKIVEVFAPHDGADYNKWDLERERQHRLSGKPYVLHIDEYLENQTGFEQIVLTYFVEDGILSDEDDEVVGDIDDFVGVHNLERFGHGSVDLNVVHVRNDKREIEFEIRRSMGSYANETQNVRPSRPLGL